MLKNDLTPRPARSSRSSHRGAQDGASLIEIMVVLVILLIGVFLAIRIFPAGLATLKTTENRGRAIHLAQQELGDTVSNAANLPAGILAASVVMDSNGNYVVNFNTTHDPDDLINKDPANTDPTSTDINISRYVQDEPVKIAVPVTASTGGTVSEYLVKFGPMQMDSTVGKADSGPVAGNLKSQSEYGAYLSVRSGALGVTPFASQNGTNGGTALAYLQGPLNCMFDAGSGTTAFILFASGATGNYLLSYSYYTTTNPTAANPVYTVSAIANQQLAVVGGNWQQITLPTNSNGIVPGSLVATRVFDRAASSLPFSSTNPFQYKLASDNIQDNGTDTNVNPGLIYFNPAAAGLTRTTAAGQQAATAYVSYFVADWHILHDDVQVPTVSPNTAGLIPVKLSLDVLKRVGDANANNTIYYGVYSQSSATGGTGTNDVDVIDLGAPAAGTMPSLSQGTVVRGVPNPALTNANAAAYYIDTDSRSGTYATGTVYVNPNVLPQGSQIRVYYQADGDWAIGLQRAYAQYTPELGASATSTTTGVTTTNYNSAIQTRPLNYNTFGVDRSSGANRIYFTRADLNKSVVISLQYVSQGTVIRVPPTQFTIDNLDTADKVGGQFVYSFIDLTKGANANALSPTDQAGITGDANWTVYGPIQGVSVKTRVLWHDNNNVNNNWRVQDLDTFLTAGS